METLAGTIYVHSALYGAQSQTATVVHCYCLFDAEPLLSPLATAGFTVGEDASLATKHKTMQLPAKESTAERTLSMCNMKWGTYQ